MSSASEATHQAASAEEVDNSLFDLAVENMKFEGKACHYINGEQNGGNRTPINLENITILIILFHGVLPFNPHDTLRKEHTLDTSWHINPTSLPDNLAYLSLAPTPYPNIGTTGEVLAYREFVTSEMKVSFLQSLINLNKKTDALIFKESEESKNSKKEKRHRTETPEQKPSFFNRVCKYCFNIPAEFMSSLVSTVRTLGTVGTLTTNFIFTGNFSVCKTPVRKHIHSDDARYGASRQSSQAQSPSRRSRSRSPSPSQPQPTIEPRRFFRMSYDMCIILFNNLRVAIKNFDRIRFPTFCQQIIDSGSLFKWTPEFCRAGIASTDHRCNRIEIVKGFGTTNIKPYANKGLGYTQKNDFESGMGIVGNRYQMDEKGRIYEIFTTVTPQEVIMETHGSGEIVSNRTYSFSMQDCIQIYTKRDPLAKTILLVDMSCSGVPTGDRPVLSDEEREALPIRVPGGGRGIKKKSGSMKKTRRHTQTKKIKNKSKSSKNIRNRRNRIKPKNRTHKGKQSKRQ